jgi:N-acetylmuramoyl-L-alanine amidase
LTLLNFNGAPHGGSQRHLPEWQSQPKITPKTIIDHSIVGSGESAWQMFNASSGLESHFIVLGRRSGTKDGHIWQLMDTARRADANLDANAYAISIETEDDGDPDNQPWTGAQLRSLMWLHAELRRVHPTIPQRQSRSCGDPGGLGYHTLHGAPSCWTPVAKSCPGAVRKQQWRDALLPDFLAGPDHPNQEDDMSAEDVEAINAHIDKHSKLIRVGDVQSGAADTHDFSSIEGVGRQVKNLDAQVAELGGKVDQILELLTTPPPSA